MTVGEMSARKWGEVMTASVWFFAFALAFWYGFRCPLVHQILSGLACALIGFFPLWIVFDSEF